MGAAMWLLYDAKFWFSVMILLIILEMTLDGSMIFLLPTGVGAGITGLSLYACHHGFGIICSIYENWYMLIVNTAIFSLAAYFIIQKYLGKKDETPDVNDF